MDKSILVVGLLFVLVLFSGCIKISIIENISETGMSDISIKMDMSAFPQQPDQEDQDPCEQMMQDIEAGQQVPLENIRCTYEDKVLTLSGQIDRSHSEALAITDGKYRFDVKKALTEFSSAEAGGQSLPETGDEQQVQQLKAMGFEYNYIVKLPGTVTNQAGGEIQGDGSVKFDVLDLPEGAFVESSTAAMALDTNLMLIAGVAVVVLVIVLIVLLKRR